MKVSTPQAMIMTTVTPDSCSAITVPNQCYCSNLETGTPASIVTSKRSLLQCYRIMYCTSPCADTYYKAPLQQHTFSTALNNKHDKLNLYNQISNYTVQSRQFNWHKQYSTCTYFDQKWWQYCPRIFTGTCDTSSSVPK